MYITHGCILDVLLFDLELILTHEGTAYKLPAEVGKESFEIFLYIFLANLAAIGLEEPALHKGFGKIEFGLLHEIVTDILGKPPFCLLGILAGQTLLEFLLYILISLLFLLILIILLEVLQHVYLLLRGGADGILVNNILLAGRNFEFRICGDVEHESEVVSVLPLNLGLILASERLSEHIQLILIDKILKPFRNHFVHGLGKNLVAIHAAHQAFGHHSLTESLEVCGLAALGEFLAFNFCVVALFDVQGEFDVKSIELFLF